MAAKKGDIEEAVVWYEEAVSVDAVNADLWDRFAWFLMAKVGNFERATDCSKTALRLDSNNADFYFTAGMIAARKKEIIEADRLLMKAAELGKAKYLCLMERARARIEYAAPDRDINDWWDRLNEADNFIKEAKELPMDYRYESKNQLTCELLLERSNNIRLIRKSRSPVRPR